ncbi:hypothetical protein ANCCEY_05300 [Ancylostoma ceylanicum]|uniref:DDE Tnp4 domain-containing protein n=2 Tax=Ancylostoma ceylanicum TaxID=53326 RepID=A0A0D6LZT0_9BILA|nr:hypothetical protein ANCCEY_05300 [Ancylostoma ceylanicum]EYC12712.1 hypothetical protein Y032_0046g1381 [Ancylostoma ceylanicum]
MVAIVDARGRFLYIDCRFPGRCHDSAIWSRSEGASLFEDGRTAPGYRLIGDSGFRSSASIVTPFREAATRDDERKSNFNDEHSRARVVVEQAFGALKRRFPILYNVACLEPPKLHMLVVACCTVQHQYHTWSPERSAAFGAYACNSTSPTFRRGGKPVRREWGRVTVSEGATIRVDVARTALEVMDKLLG